MIFRYSVYPEINGFLRFSAIVDIYVNLMLKIQILSKDKF